MQQQKPAFRSLLWIAPICDIVILFCYGFWLPIAQHQFSERQSRCTAQYSYYSNGVKCVSYEGCANDKDCHVNTAFLYDNTDCGTNDCPVGDCHCNAKDTWHTFYTYYVIFFSISMVMEFVKLMIAVSASCEGSMDMVKDSMLSECMDSWSMFIVRALNPKRFEAFVKLNEEGKVPVVTNGKLSQWAFRDFICGIIITLYLEKLDYFNEWFVIYAVAMGIYILCVWLRYRWFEAVRPLPVPVVVASQPIGPMIMVGMPQQTNNPYMVVQQQPVISSNVMVNVNSNR